MNWFNYRENEPAGQMLLILLKNLLYLLCYNKNMMIKPKKIIHCRRKSIAIIVNRQGEILVRAPYYASAEEIMRFIKLKQPWLEKQVNLTQMEKKRYKPITLQEGDIVKFKGKDYTVGMRGLAEITFFGDYLLLPYNTTKEFLIAWLQKEAEKELRVRVSYYAAYMHVKPTFLRLSNAHTTWGSCSFNNRLSFSWRLIMCPPAVLDYVVVHELSHINNKGHGKKFWQCVALVLPDYKEQEAWLKANRRIMEIL